MSRQSSSAFCPVCDPSYASRILLYMGPPSQVVRGEAKVHRLERLPVADLAAFETAGARLEEAGEGVAVGARAKSRHLRDQPRGRILRQLGRERVEVRAHVGNGRGTALVVLEQHPIHVEHLAAAEPLG